MERNEVKGLLDLYEAEASRMPDRINPYGEMENILDGRDLIEDDKDKFSEDELKRLAVADERLRRHADKLPKMIGFDYRKWREKAGIPRSRWWWWADESVSS